MLAGIPIADRHVLDLARRLHDAGHAITAERLESACYEQQTSLLALTITERERILEALVDCPRPLAELRAVLLQEREWRRREGLG